MRIGLLFFLAMNCLFALPDALLDRFGIPRDLPEHELLQTVQSLWYQPNKERWEFDHRYEEMRGELEPIFEEMGYLLEKPPANSSYKYALIHGALIWSVQKRVAYLEKAIQSGVSFERIVFLMGTRSLRADERELLGPEFEDESEMMRWVYDHSSLPRDIPVDFMHGPPNGLRRSKTGDAIRVWLAAQPEPGSCLSFSNQPYVLFQYAAARRLLPPEFSLETVGEKANSNWFVALILDCIARTLFEEEPTQV